MNNSKDISWNTANTSLGSNHNQWEDDDLGNFPDDGSESTEHYNQPAPSHGDGNPTPTPNSSGWFNIKLSEWYAKWYEDQTGDTPGTGNPSGTT
jgi:hypothetical protein